MPTAADGKRRRVSRRRFLLAAGAAGAAAAAGTVGALKLFRGSGETLPREGEPSTAPPEANAKKPSPVPARKGPRLLPKGFKAGNRRDRRIAAATGGDPYRATIRAVELLGGMGRLVSQGDLVCVKPSIGWAKPPEVAANTNPRVVAAIIRMCLEAGARKVRVLDMPAESVRKTGRLSIYAITGIQAAVEEEVRRSGAADRVELHVVVNSGFRSFAIPGATHYPKFGFYVPALECDVLISVPVLKTHGGVGASIGLKNLMGLIDDRKALHKNDIQAGIVDINRLIRVDLAIMDAWKVMRTGGPRGKGNSKYKDARTVAAGVDRVALDSYGLHVLERRHDSVKHIRLASGVVEIPGVGDRPARGTSDWKSVGLIEATL